MPEMRVAVAGFAPVITAVTAVSSAILALPKRLFRSRRRHLPRATVVCALADAGEADSAWRLLRTIPGPAPVECYSATMRALLDASRPLDAEKLFDEMLTKKIDPDCAVFLQLVRTYALHLSRPDLARGVLRWMCRLGYSPNVAAYSIFIKGLCRCGFIGEAFDVLDEMSERQCSPDVHTYAPLLQYFCSEKMIHEAKKLLRVMEERGCAPDVLIYNIYIQGLCNVSWFDVVEQVIGESWKHGWKPDAHTYSAYIVGLCKAGKAENAYEMFNTMLEMGLMPETVSLNFLLDSVGTTLGVSKSEELLGFCNDMGFVVNTVSYNTLMSQFCDHGRWWDVIKLFVDMLKIGVTADTYSYNILISSLCRAGKFWMAKSIFHSKGFVADTVTYNILIHEFYESGNKKEIVDLLSDMALKNISPDIITQNTLIDCYCRTGGVFEDWNHITEIEGGYPALPTGHLIFWLIRSDQAWKVFRLIDEMLKKGLTIDPVVVNYAIMAFCCKCSCKGPQMSKLYFMLDRILGIG